jgi:hypothetical protein
MLSNLSKRERMLALIAGIMLPVFLGLVSLVWFMNSLSRYDVQISELTSQVDHAQMLRKKELEAKRRRQRYLELSLASAPEQAKVQYREWLAGVAQDVFGPNGYVLESINSNGMRFNQNVNVGEKLSVRLNVPAADLGQLDSFLFRFYDAKILHRISALTATPIAAKSGPAEQMAPTGKIGLLIQIEALALAEADKAKVIPDGSSGTLARDLAEYRARIEARNIFGLPNNAPQITSSAEPSEFEGREVDLAISAREPDENDQLKFELVSSEIEGATLVQRDPKSRSAQLASAALKPGEYKFKIRVTDSGFPPKSDEREFTLTIKQKEVIAAKPPPPKFLHAQEAVVVAIVKDASGKSIAWVHLRTLGKTHKLSVGDSFDLDGASWKLVRIDSESLSLEVDGKVQTFQIGDHLDKPRSSTSPAAVNTEHAEVRGS